jgi:predicted transcriptional regulator
MTFIEQVPITALPDLARLEADVAAALPRGKSLPSIRKAPSDQSEPMPDYVEHQNGVSRVGALSAEAVARDYEAAAKEIEAMGAELISAAQKCEAMTAEVHNAIAYVRDTAAAYREEAKKIFKRIEDCALLTEDVRKTCEAIKHKIEGDKIA